MSNFFFFLLTKLTSETNNCFLNVGTTESLVSKKLLATMKITEAAIYRRSLKNLKVKKQAKSTKIKFTGCRLLVVQWNKFRDRYFKKSWRNFVKL